MYKDHIVYLTKDFDYIIDVLNMYINCPFFNETQKLNLTEFRNLIIKGKSKASQKYQIIPNSKK